MNKYLPFILPEVILRLNNASPYHAFILKSKIEEFHKETQIQKTVKNAISYGCKFRYFDTERMDEDVIFIQSVEDNSAIGERLSDNKTIKTPLESISLAEQINENEKRMEFDGFEARPLDRVAFSHRNQGKTYVSGRIILLGYLVRHSHNTSKIRLLGGDLITVSRYNHSLYHPTAKDLELFKQVESDKYFINKELDRTVALIEELGNEMDLDIEANSNKLTRLLAIRGCTSANIKKAIEQEKGSYL